MKSAALSLLLVILFGCNTTTGKQEQQTRDVSTDDKPSQSMLSNINRFPPRYPMRHARSGTEGCATIAYTLQPNLALRDVQVVDATEAAFAEEAMKVIRRWEWAGLTGKEITEPLHLKTRFEYCLEDGSGRCTISRLTPKTRCSGDDLIASVGSKMQ